MKTPQRKSNKAAARKRPATRPDPIFAAIEKHRIANAAFHAASSDARSIELSGTESAARIKLCAVTPQTVAGCAALLRYVGALSIDGGEPNGDGGGALFERNVAGKAASTLLHRVAAVLDGNGGVS